MNGHGIDANARLNPDGLIEAIIDFRFTHAEVPELVLGKLTDLQPGWAIDRLPMADFPAQLRRADPNLLFQPLLQLNATDGSQTLRIGENSVSRHVLAPYPGWGDFKTDIAKTADYVLSNIKGSKITRIGLRYLNVMLPEKHKVTGIESTTLSLKISGSDITEKLNINYQRDIGDMTVLVRLATPEFVTGPGPGFSVLIDIDVFTPPVFSVTTTNAVVEWTDRGHMSLKNEFFGLIRPEILADLVER